MISIQVIQIMNKKGLVKVSLLLAIVFLSQTITFAANHKDQIDEFMKQCYQRGLFNGSVLVAENGKMIYKNGFGYANLEWNIPNAPDTRFRLCSITKTFTAILTLQLVEAGKINLDDTIDKYLPNYLPEFASQITIEQLLAQTSGIPNFTRGEWSPEAAKQFSMDQIITEYCHLEPVFAPGTNFLYSNTGYLLLSAIIEKVTGKPYEEVLREQILTPAGMNDTQVENMIELVPRRAQGYTKGLGGFVNGRFSDIRSIYGAGSILSTVEDMYRYDQALYDDTLLGKKYRSLMITPKNYMASHKVFYGYGWEIDKLALPGKKDSLTVCFHDGGWIGFITRFARLVDDQHLIVLLNNTDNIRLDGIYQGIVNLLYDLPATLPRIPITDVLVETMANNGVEAAIAQYHDLKRDAQDEYIINESSLNVLGYALLDQGRSEEALRILKLNVEEYPASSNVYDSMGEAYYKTGDLDSAVINYAKSLELNPHNSNAIQMLQKIASE